MDVLPEKVQIDLGEKKGRKPKMYLGVPAFFAQNLR